MNEASLRWSKLARYSEKLQRLKMSRIERRFSSQIQLIYRRKRAISHSREKNFSRIYSRHFTCNSLSTVNLPWENNKVDFDCLVIALHYRVVTLGIPPLIVDIFHELSLRSFRKLLKIQSQRGESYFLFPPFQATCFSLITKLLAYENSHSTCGPLHWWIFFSIKLEFRRSRKYLWREGFFPVLSLSTIILNKYMLILRFRSSNGYGTGESDGIWI